MQLYTSSDSPAIFTQKSFNPNGVRIFVVRHGEGTDNIGKVFDTHASQSIHGLTEKGKEQSKNIILGLVQNSCVFHVCSTSPRAMETMDLWHDNDGTKYMTHSFGAITEFAEPLFCHGEEWSSDKVYDLNNCHFNTPYATVTAKARRTESGHHYYNRTFTALELLCGAVLATYAKNPTLVIFAHFHTCQILMNIASGTPFATKQLIDHVKPYELNFVQFPPMHILHPQAMFVSFQVPIPVGEDHLKFFDNFKITCFASLPWLKKIDAYVMSDKICIELTKRFTLRQVDFESFLKLREYCMTKFNACPLDLGLVNNWRIVLGTHFGYTGKLVENPVSYGLAEPNAWLSATWRNSDGSLESYPSSGYEPCYILSVSGTDFGKIAKLALTNGQECYTAMNLEGKTLTICVDEKRANK